MKNGGGAAIKSQTLARFFNVPCCSSISLDDGFPTALRVIIELCFGKAQRQEHRGRLLILEPASKFIKGQYKIARGNFFVFE